MIKKIAEVSSFIIKRRYLIFLISFLLISSFSQAACRPEEAYNNTPKEDISGKIYVSEGTGLFVADGTMVVVNEVVYIEKEVKSLKTKHHKKRVDKLKTIKHNPQAAKSSSSLPPTETVTSKDFKHMFGSNSPNAKEAYINTNYNNYKSLAVTIYNILIDILLSSLIILISFYNRHFIKALLLGSNFQRPPPAFL